ncbi:MAG: hypothetical protein LBD15_03440 [Holosporales bacterium]|jgi:hypothetical protein|nr:hypothetical protein [Holosporales bacterium]
MFIGAEAFSPFPSSFGGAEVIAVDGDSASEEIEGVEPTASVTIAFDGGPVFLKRDSKVLRFVQAGEAIPGELFNDGDTTVEYSPAPELAAEHLGSLSAVADVPLSESRPQ